MRWPGSTTNLLSDGAARIEDPSAPEDFEGMRGTLSAAGTEATAAVAAGGSAIPPTSLSFPSERPGSSGDAAICALPEECCEDTLLLQSGASRVEGISTEPSSTEADEPLVEMVAMLSSEVEA